MESTKIINELHNVISKNLFFAYQKNTAKVSSTNQNFEVVDNYYHFNNFSIALDFSTISNEISLIGWRFPKSRIYFSEIPLKNIKISVVEYLEEAFIVIQNFSQEEKQNLEITSNNKAFPFSEITKKTSFNTKIELAPTTNIVISNFKTENSLPKYLEQLLSTERKIHPLSFIISEDNELLKEIDDLWSKLQWIKKGTAIKIDYDSQHAQFEMAVLFLAEIVQLADRYYELQDFFTKGSDNNSFLSRIKKKYSKKENYNKKTFISDLLFNGEPNHSIVKTKIQEVWNIISTPSRDLYFADFVQTYPVEACAFLILVLKNNFWWKKEAAARFDAILVKQNNPFLHLWRLYSKLALNNFLIDTSSETTKIDIVGFTENSNLTSLENEVISYQIVKKGEKYFCSTTFRNFPQIWIDKEFTVEYIKNNSVLIKPFTYQYDSSFENTILIKYEKIVLKIVLAWKSFVVKIGGLRIKFLFKGDRYQISVKGARWIKSCEIAGVACSFENVLYKKMYFKPVKTKRVEDLHFFNELGSNVDITKLEKYNSLHFHGIITNQFGHVADSVSINFNDSKKNMRVNPLNTFPHEIRKEKRIKVVIPKSGNSVYKISIQDTLLSRIMNENALHLSQQLVIFIDESAGDYIEINALFYTHFGFYPNIVKKEFLNTTIYKYGIIVSDLVEEIFVPNSERKRVILIRPNMVKKWLNEHFQLIENV